jgi:hypoxia up-regulated 1
VVPGTGIAPVPVAFVHTYRVPALTPSLNNIATHERKRHSREEARNHLEGYLYRLQGLLDPESENKAIHEFGRAEEKEALGKALGAAFEWLGENAEKADEETLRVKRKEIE